MSLNQLSKIIERPKNISRAIINRAIIEAIKKFSIPKSTNTISNGSIGNNFATPEKTKVAPTITLNMWFNIFITKKAIQR